MANAFTVSRSQAIFGLCIPLAVLVGYLLARPYESTTLAVLVFLFTVILGPLIIQWYHPALLICWNAAITPFFLVGWVHLWTIVAWVGFIVALVNRAVNPAKKFINVPGVTRSLIFLTLVILFTAATTGGMGARALGSETYGGRKYFYILAAIAGYFALTSRRIPVEKATLWTTIFFLAGITSLVSNLIYMAGSKFYFLFYLFPAEFAVGQAVTAERPINPIPRVTGAMPAAWAVIFWLLAKYGLRGSVDLSKPWRTTLFFGAIIIGLMSGFRSFVIFLLLVLCVQFFLEGLHRTPFILSAGAVTIIGFGLLMGCAYRLPTNVQRALSFLPVPVDPAVRSDAEGSFEWRLEMWRYLLPDIPKYLLKGKGYAINPREHLLSWESARRGAAPTSDPAMVTADYHNGPLSVLIPFGIWGALAVVWFWIAAGRVLYLNYKYGHPALHYMNTALFALFIAKVVNFVVFVGALSSDMAQFTGLLGLSISLNCGVAPRTVPELEFVEDEPQLATQTA